MPARVDEQIPSINAFLVGLPTQNELWDTRERKKLAGVNSQGGNQVGR